MINNNAKTSIQERTEDFAIRVIKAYCELKKDILTMQLRSYQNSFWEVERNTSNELGVMSNES